MQAAGDFVGVVIELTARMELRHDDFGGRPTLAFVHVDRNPAPIILDSDRVVVVDSYIDPGAVTGLCVVDGVVHQLEHHMVQT